MSYRFPLTALALGLIAAQPALAVDIQGRFEFDYAHYEKDELGLQNEAIVRRARLGAEGNFDDIWSFDFDIDFSDGEEVEIQTALLLAEVREGIEIHLGQHKPPGGLERTTSSANLVFMERSSPTDTLTEGNRLGISAHYLESDYLLQGGLFIRDLNDDAHEDGEKTSLFMRGVYHPVTEWGQHHIGFNYSRENTHSMAVDSPVRFRTTPEVEAGSYNTVNTRRISHVDRIDRMGIEFAWEYSAFAFQAEYLRAEVNRDDREDLTFSGWYAEASYRITGESRRYQSGRFRNVHPERSGIGAWEVGIRRSHLDLNSKTVTGGEQDITALALNWTPTQDVRFMLNYIIPDVSSSDEMDSNVLTFRTHVRF